MMQRRILENRVVRSVLAIPVIIFAFLYFGIGTLLEIIYYKVLARFLYNEFWYYDNVLGGWHTPGICFGYKRGKLIHRWRLSGCKRDLENYR